MDINFEGFPYGNMCCKFVFGLLMNKLQNSMAFLLSCNVTAHVYKSSNNPHLIKVLQMDLSCAPKKLVLSFNNLTSQMKLTVGRNFIYNFLLVNRFE